MNKKYVNKRNFGVLFLIIIFIIWSFTVSNYGPEKIIEILGTNNAYFTLGLMALLGGSSILFPFPYYLFTISFGAAGLNPFLLGIAAGAGTLLGDATTYYIASKGRHLLPEKINLKLQKILVWLMGRHPATFPIIAFLYSSIAPLPDDVLMVPAGIAHYPFSRLALGVGPGKVLFNTILAFSGLYGWSLFF